MKKRLFIMTAILLLIAMLCVFAACNELQDVDQEKNDKGPSAVKNVGVVEISVNSFCDDLVAYARSQGYTGKREEQISDWLTEAKKGELFAYAKITKTTLEGIEDTYTIRSYEPGKPEPLPHVYTLQELLSLIDELMYNTAESSARDIVTVISLFALEDAGMTLGEYANEMKVINVDWNGSDTVTQRQISKLNATIYYTSYDYLFEQGYCRFEINIINGNTKGGGGGVLRGCWCGGVRGVVGG